MSNTFLTIIAGIILKAILGLDFSTIINRIKELDDDDKLSGQEKFEMVMGDLKILGIGLCKAIAVMVIELGLQYVRKFDNPMSPKIGSV